MEERRYDVEECCDRSWRPGALRRLIAALTLALLGAAGLATPWAQARLAATEHDNPYKFCLQCCKGALPGDADRRALANCFSLCLAPEEAVKGRNDGPCPPPRLPEAAPSSGAAQPLRLDGRRTAWGLGHRR